MYIYSPGVSIPQTKPIGFYKETTSTLSDSAEKDRKKQNSIKNLMKTNTSESEISPQADTFGDKRFPSNPLNSDKIQIATMLTNDEFGVDSWIQMTGIFVGYVYEFYRNHFEFDGLWMEYLMVRFDSVFGSRIVSGFCRNFTVDIRSRI